MAIALDVTFNEKSLSNEFGIGLLSYKVQSAPTRKTRGIDIPGRDGTYKVNSSYSSKSIELSVVVEGATPEKVHEKIRKFLSWLSQQDQPKVVFTDNPKVFVYADLDEADEYYVTRGVENAMTQLTITLYQYDPFFYENGKMSYTWECIPGEVYNVLNEGIHTPYVIRLSGTESALTQYNSTSLGHNAMDGTPVSSNINLVVNGVAQSYAGTIGYKDVLEVDGKELTIAKNGISVISDWEGDINDLIYGDNTFVMTNLENENLYVTIEFYRRWL